MALVMISGRYQSGRHKLAKTLSRLTNWPVLSREELQELARQQGIRVGRLEVSMIKRPVLSEKLAREKEFYLAFLTATLCEKALAGPLIYNGRAGHLLLPGLRSRIRVGLTAPQDVRIENTVHALNMTPDKAEIYLEQLDDDVDKWIRYVHRVDGYSPGHFDIFLNLENTSVSNAAKMLCAMAELPDYQPNAASRRALENLYLESHAKVRLATGDRTSGADLQIRADDGVVTVTYPPHQAYVSEHIPGVLADLPGCREIQCTMAETNILWVQERFDPASENFSQVLHLAQRWGAAVELMRLLPPDEPPQDSAADGSPTDFEFGRRECSAEYDGGVEDDDPAGPVNDGGLHASQEELVNMGRSGGIHTVCGGYDKILERAGADGQYALVVVGDMFLSKGHSTRARRTRELAMTIRDRLKAPVITADELKSHFLFGKRQAVTLAVFLGLVLLIYNLLFTHQEQVLTFLSGPVHQHNKWLAPLVIVCFIPLVAYLYGTVTELALKIINVD